jgi:hypothetical protein
MLHQHPLPHSESIRDPMTEEGAVTKLNDILQQKAYEITYLDEVNTKLSTQMTTLQARLEETLNLLDER